MGIIKRDNPIKLTGVRIKESHRNDGYSLGLQYPYLYYKMEGTWMIWHRHTGEVVKISQESNKVVAKKEIEDLCYQLNGLSKTPNAEVLIEMDLEA